jgi:hypothetical protein
VHHLHTEGLNFELSFKLAVYRYTPWQVRRAEESSKRATANAPTPICTLNAVSVHMTRRARWHSAAGVIVAVDRLLTGSGVVQKGALTQLK